MPGFGVAGGKITMMRKREPFKDKVTALPGGDVAIEIVCRECGKPLTVVNDYGLFCEDLCGFKESKKAASHLKKMIEDLGEMFNRRKE